MEKKLNSKAIKAIEDSIKLWSWLGETGKYKWEWPEWKANGGTYPKAEADCFLCSATERDCNGCPLYAEEGDKLDCSDYAFHNWELAQTIAERKKYAKKFVEELRALLPYKGNGNGKAAPKYKVGDKVEITWGSKSRPWGQRKGQIGTVELLASDDCLVMFADGEHWWYAYDQFVPAPDKSIKRVYVAGALSSLPANEWDERSSSKVVVDYIQNCSSMCSIAAAVRKEGYIPYVPALDFLLGWKAGNFDEEDYRGIGMGFLEVCDAVLVISDSTGVNREVARAKELGIPVAYSIPALAKLGVRK